MKNKVSIVFFGIVLVILIAGCKKKKENQECSSDYGTVSLNFTHMVGPEAFAFNSDYIDDFGNNFQFSRADWYLKVSGFLDHDNVTQILSEINYYKMDPSVTSVTYGQSLPTTLHNLQWAVGIDSATNHMDPNTYETGSALANQSPSMHWGWSTGYIFCVVEGLVDIDGNGSYDPGETFALHVGMDTNYREGTNLHVSTEVIAGETANISLDVDYAGFIDGIDLSTENSTHTMDNMPLAVKVSDNFGKVLKLH